MPDKTPRTKAEKQNAVHEVMSEYKEGKLHSGSKKGPKVKSRKQAVAIAMSESGQSKPNYDRSSHYPGNPGFPSSSEAGGSPPPKTFQSHESREKQVMGAGYKVHERLENRPHRIGGGSSPLRLSCHKGAHQIGKRGSK